MRVKTNKKFIIRVTIATVICAIVCEILIMFDVSAFLRYVIGYITGGIVMPLADYLANT